MIALPKAGPAVAAAIRIEVRSVILRREYSIGAGKRHRPALPFAQVDRPHVAAVGATLRMKSQAALTTASAPPRRESSRPGRVWLVAALVLLAVPLAVAVWGLGGNAAQRERNNADAGLTDRLNFAARSYRNLVSDADAAARRLANNRQVHRVLIWRLRPSKEHPHGQLTRWHGSIPAAAVVRHVDFVTKRRTVGQVVVFVPLDRHLVGWLKQRAHLSDQQELALGRGGNLVGVERTLRVQSRPLDSGPGDIRAGGSDYRALVEPLGPTARGSKLVALELRSSIDSKASSAHWRVMGLGLAVILAIVAFAYAVSPSIARSRVSRQERERAERVLAHVGDGVFLVDPDGVIRLWNPAAEAITGLRADAICDRSAEETIPGWAMIGARVPVARRPGDADDASSAETVPLEIEGREIWLSILGATLGDGIVYAFRDVTRERRLEELRAQFVATISHELRTPLASLHGAAMTLLEREQDLHEQTRHDLLDMIAVQSKRLAVLVEEIRLTGQLDSGSFRVVTEPFDAEELVWTAAATARLRMSDDTTTIAVSIPAVLPKVAGDAERTRQVLTNLVDNAIK